MSSVFEWRNAPAPQPSEQPAQRRKGQHMKSRVYVNGGHPASVKVDQLTLEGEYVGTFRSVADAARQLECNPATIRAVVGRSHRSAIGFRWEKSRRSW